MKRLVQVTVAMGSFTIVNMVVGFVRSKYSALALGPDGVGLLSQATSFLLVAITVCAFNSGTGIVKRLAEAFDSGDHRRVGEILDTSFQLLSLTGLLAVLALALLRSPIAATVFGDTGLALAFLGVAIALPFDVLTASLWQAIILGADRYELYTRASVAATLAGVVPFVLMTYLWGLVGAILSIAVVAFIRHAVFLGYALPLVRWRPRITGHLSADVVRSLVGYGAAMLGVAILVDGSGLIVRTLILKHLGAAANGLYQVPVAMSSYYSVFFTNGLWGHLYPRISRPLSPEERRDEVNSAIRFITLGVTVLAVALVALRDPLIVIVYSSRFSEATGLVPLYVVGDLFFLLAAVYTVSLLSVPRLGAYVILWVAFCASRTVLSWLFLLRWGLEGAAAGYAVSAAALALVCAVHHAWRLGVPISSRNALVLGSAVVVVAGPLALPLPWSLQLLAQVVLIGGWLFAVVSSEEWTMARRLLFRYIPGRRGAADGALHG